MAEQTPTPAPGPGPGTVPTTTANASPAGEATERIVPTDPIDPAEQIAPTERIVPATVADLETVLAQHGRFWGGRDLRGLHLTALVQEFPATCLVAVAEDGIRGYIFGFVTPDRVAYVHLIATRDDARGTGLGRRLYAAFIEAGRALGAQRLKAITSVANEGSIAFHRSLGFTVREVADYNGLGHARVVFTRDLDPRPAPDGSSPSNLSG